MIMIITTVIVHTCAQQLNTYFKAVCVGVFCVISVQVAYQDTSLVCGGSPYVRSPFRGSSQHQQSDRLISGLSRLDEGSLQALGHRTIQKKMSVSSDIFGQKQRYK